MLGWFLAHYLVISILSQWAMGNVCFILGPQPQLMSPKWFMIEWKQGSHAFSFNHEWFNFINIYKIFFEFFCRMKMLNYLSLNYSWTIMSYSTKKCWHISHSDRVDFLYRLFNFMHAIIYFAILKSSNTSWSNYEYTCNISKQQLISLKLVFTLIIISKLIKKTNTCMLPLVSRNRGIINYIYSIINIFKSLSYHIYTSA